MPDRGPSRLRAALAAGVLGIVLASPAALAQTGEVPPPSAAPPGEDSSARWAGSSFSSPFDGDEPTVRSQPFTAAGVLRYEKPTPPDQIARAEVRVVDDPSDTWAPGEDCELPLPMVVPGQGEHDNTGFVSVLRFEVPDLQVSCNGRFLLEAEGFPTDPGAPSHLMRRSFVVGVLPESVNDLTVALDADARKVEVAFTPLDDEQLSSDAIGYVVERGGPAAGDAPVEDFVDVGRLDLDDEPRFVDDLRRAAGGTYTYRVRATRHGAHQPERSSVITTATATVTIDAPPRDGDATSTIDRTRSSRSRASAAPRRSSGTGGSRTITTIDTGFEGEIDYGADGLPRNPGELPDFGDDPLAGQSLIRDEGDGMDLAAPVAGALVLLGWAGHIAYLNRLAKQL
jgi:hypothetical protein